MDTVRACRVIIAREMFPDLLRLDGVKATAFYQDADGNLVVRLEGEICPQVQPGDELPLRVVMSKRQPSVVSWLHDPEVE